MKFPNPLELLTSGFYSALSQFRAEFFKQQEQYNAMLTDKLNQILQNQAASEEAIAAINETISTETAQVTEAVAKLVDVNAQQSQLIEQQSQQIKDLLIRVEEGGVDLAEANAVIDQILQKQQEQLAAQQEATSRIASIFNPEQ